jgi:diguanylate cyclase (GGDEF)-like protein
VFSVHFDQQQIEEALSPARPRTLSLAFPPSLEQRFNRETTATQIQALTRMGIAGILLFNIFLLTDYILFPRDFWRCIVIRLFFFTPAAALTIFVGRACRSSNPREFAKLLIMILTGTCALAVGDFHAAGSSLLAQINLLLVLAFGNLILRLRFPLALTLNLIWIAEDLIYLTRFANLDRAYKITCAFIFINIAVTTLFAAYEMERNDRKVYLLSLREQVRNMELVRTNNALDQLATSDPLTGLANRRQLDRRLGEIGSDPAAPRTASLSVILADLDHFKRVNDLHGHLVGDYILTRVADVLRAHIRIPEDLVARFGGEEFVVLLPNVSQSVAVGIAERLRRDISSTLIPVANGLPPLRLTISCGVATGTLDTPAAARTLLEQADQALYQAKNSGRDRVAIFSSSETAPQSTP